MKSKKYIYIAVVVIVCFSAFLVLKNILSISMFVLSRLSYYTNSDTIKYVNSIENKEYKKIATYFLKRNCQKTGDDVWSGCSVNNRQPSAIEDFKNECAHFGYNFYCAGWCSSVECYKFSDAKNACNDSSKCQSGWCKPSDDRCGGNCAGSCSDIRRPGACDEAGHEYVELKNSEIVKFTSGGALCD